jgi:DNA-binding MarR family transcriptional regulator
LTQAKYDPVRDALPPGSRAEALERTVALVGELMHVLQQQRVPAFLEIGITMSQAKVLFVVSAAGEMHMSALAERIGVSLSTVSGIVDRLVDHELLVRHDDPTDRRQVVVSATEAGVALTERFRDLNSLIIRSLLGSLSGSDLAVIERAVTILSRAVAAIPMQNALPPNTHPARKEPS